MKTITLDEHKKALSRSRYKASKRLAHKVEECQVKTERKLTPKIPFLKELVDLIRSLDDHLRRKK